MVSRVTTRFYSVAPFSKATPEVADVLSSIGSVPEKKDRFRNAGGEDGEELKVRLERFALDGDYVSGEFTRLQDEDIPPQVTDQGLKPVQLDGLGLGHCAAFVLHKPTKCLALQINPNSVSHNSISGYLHAFDPKAQYALLPVPTRSTWDLFDSSEPRSFTIGIASPKNLKAVNDPDDPVLDALSEFHDLFDGHVITIEVSVGRKRDATLNKGQVRKYLELILGMQSKKGTGPRSLTVQSNKKNAVGEYEELNFLREFLKEKELYDLPSDDDQRNYALRDSALKKAFRKHIGYLKEFYE